MNETAKILKLSDGRTLAFAEYGDPDGVPVFYFHGAPSSRLEPMAIGEDALARIGLRVIAPDRPGIGMSEFQPGRGFSNWPDDVVELADFLHLRRFALLGNSGGGSYVLACAARIPERVTAAVIVSCGWRMDAPEVKENLPLVNRIFWILARRFPPGLRLLLNTMRNPSRSSREVELEKLRPHLPAADLSAMAEPGRIEALQGAIQECLRGGTEGAAWDVRLYVHPFDFDFAEAKIPIHFFRGAQDRNVPIALARRMVRQIPSATITEFPIDGHFSTLSMHIDEISARLTTQR